MVAVQTRVRAQLCFVDLDLPVHAGQSKRAAMSTRAEAAPHAAWDKIVDHLQVCVYACSCVCACINA